MAYILIAEDEQAINDLICKNLKLVGHKTVQVFDGQQALDSINSDNFDLVLLDIMMPGLSGLEVKKLIPQDIPVIFVTAKHSVSDQLIGLGLGADDYIVKPFDILVLLARVENILRRTKKNSTVFTIKDCKIDLNSRTVTRKGEEVILGYSDFVSYKITEVPGFKSAKYWVYIYTEKDELIRVSLLYTDTKIYFEDFCNEKMLGYGLDITELPNVIPDGVI